jgi:hypothetical protein
LDLEEFESGDIEMIITAKNFGKVYENDEKIPEIKQIYDVSEEMVF